MAAVKQIREATELLTNYYIDTEDKKQMDSMKIQQASDVLNTTIEKYFAVDPAIIDAEYMGYLRMCMPTIQNLLEASANLLHDGIIAIAE